MGIIKTYLPESLLHWLDAEYPGCSLDEAVGNCIELFFQHRVQVPRGTHLHQRQRPGGAYLKVSIGDDDLYERFQRSKNSSGSIREIVKWCKAREGQARTAPTDEDEKEADRQPMTYHYCPSCGSDLRPKRCPECNGEILGDWLFCAHCSSPLFEDDDTEAKETKPVPKAQAKPKPKAAGGTRLTGRKKRKIVAFPTDKWEIICSKYSESELLIAIEKWLDELGDDSAKYRVDFVPRGRLAKDIDFKEIKICIKSPTYKKLKETGNISGAIRALVYQNVGIPITKVLECAK